MQYINPFELLNITTTKPSNMDGVTVNKVKRKLLAEIDLSDTNTIQYKGIELTKSDLIRITDDLDNKDKCDFHLFILQDKYLNEFLCNGSLSFFDYFRFEYIYKQPEFLDFISPYFSEKYNYLLSENYRTKNLKNVTRILSIKPITNERHYDKCFRSTYAFVRSIEVEIKNIYTDIKNRKSQYIENKFIGIPELIADNVEVSLINLLPSYFQSLRNQLAQTIRNLSTEINNAPYSLYEPAFKVIEISNNLLTDGLVKQNVTKAFNIIKDNYESGIKTLKQEIEEDDDAKEKKIEDEIDSIIYKDEIAAYEYISQQFDEIIRQIENKKSKYIANKFSGLQEWLSLKINIPNLNSQPHIFVSIRNKFAIQLKNISAIIWNEFHLMEISMSIIQLANSINVDEETKVKIKTDYDTLVSIVERQKQYGKSILEAPFTGTWGFGIGEVLYKDTIYFTFLMIPILPLSRYRVERFTDKNWLNKDNSLNVFPQQKLRYYGKLKLKPWQMIWKYGLIGAFSCTILYAIISGIVYSNRHNNYSKPSISVVNTNPETSNSSSNATSDKYKLDIPSPPSSRINLPKPSFKQVPSSSKVAELKKLEPLKIKVMSDGEISDCANIYPQFNNNLDNELIISCGSNAAVAVKLVNYATNICIRYVFININSSYTIRNIPEGKYYLKIAYGNNWWYEEGKSECDGRFTKNTYYKKGTEVLDFNLTYESDGSYSVPSYSLRLNIIARTNDNMNTFDTDVISENDFYNE